MRRQAEQQRQDAEGGCAVYGVVGGDYHLLDDDDVVSSRSSDRTMSTRWCWSRGFIGMTRNCAVAERRLVIFFLLSRSYCSRLFPHPREQSQSLRTENDLSLFEARPIVLHTQWERSADPGFQRSWNNTHVNGGFLSLGIYKRRRFSLISSPSMNKSDFFARQQKTQINNLR